MLSLPSLLVRFLQHSSVVNHLFITDKVAFGLKEENVSDK